MNRNGRFSNQIITRTHCVPLLNTLEILFSRHHTNPSQFFKNLAAKFTFLVFSLSFFFSFG